MAEHRVVATVPRAGGFDVAYECPVHGERLVWVYSLGFEAECADCGEVFRVEETP